MVARNDGAVNMSFISYDFDFSFWLPHETCRILVP